MDETGFDKEPLLDVARRMDRNGQDTGPFDDLRGLTAEAGNFSTGLWLQRLLGDRRDAVIEFGARSRLIFPELASGLREVAHSLEQTDQVNARRILGEHIRDADSKIRDYDTDLEREQRFDYGGSGFDDDHDKPIPDVVPFDEHKPIDFDGDGTPAGRDDDPWVPWDDHDFQKKGLEDNIPGDSNERDPSSEDGRGSAGGHNMV